MYAVYLADKVAPQDNHFSIVDADQAKVLEVPADPKSHPDGRCDVSQEIQAPALLIVCA